MHAESVGVLESCGHFRGIKNERPTAGTELLVFPVFSYPVACAGLLCAFHVCSC